MVLVELDLVATAQQGIVQLELEHSLLVIDLEVPQLVALAQEVLELGRGALDQEVLVVMDLVARH